jgi:autotransporter passenger strand-loop-strand repeat protein
VAVQVRLPPIAHFARHFHQGREGSRPKSPAVSSRPKATRFGRPRNVCEPATLTWTRSQSKTPKCSGPSDNWQESRYHSQVQQARSPSRLTIDSGGTQIISTGGVTIGTVVSSGGTEIVSAGGTDIGAIVSSGGQLDVLSGGTAIATDLLSGGTISNAGTLDAGAGTSLTVVGVVSGGGVIEFDDGEVFIEEASSLNVSFTSSSLPFKAAAPSAAWRCWRRCAAPRRGCVQRPGDCGGRRYIVAP